MVTIWHYIFHLKILIWMSLYTSSHLKETSSCTSLAYISFKWRIILSLHYAWKFLNQKPVSSINDKYFFFHLDSIIKFGKNNIWKLIEDIFRLTHTRLLCISKCLMHRKRKLFTNLFSRLSKILFTWTFGWICVVHY